MGGEREMNETVRERVRAKKRDKIKGKESTRGSWRGVGTERRNRDENEILRERGGRDREREGKRENNR